MQHTTIKISVALLGLLSVNLSYATPPQASNLLTNSLIYPDAKGNLTEFGGASRIKQERSAQLKNAIQATRAKHVILFIGDGTSDSEITIARNYIVGAANYLKGIDVLPFTGSYTTYSIDKTGVMNYVTDSAASATAWATGHKSYNGALGVDVHGKAQATLLELAKKAGLATGNVTTTELQDATPAALYAHISHRKCYAPEATSKTCSQQALENAGLGSITEQLIRARADVTLGGGAASFKELAKAGPYRGKSLLEQAKAEGYQIIHSSQQLQALQHANQQQPVLGLFAEGNLPLLWTGPFASQGGNLQAAVSCQNNPQNTAQTPQLKDMTAKAIELLHSNPKGFFLQVESGSIDKANHASNPCGQIGETKQLDDAIQVALKFAEKHPDTLIILTGDHAHTSQIIPVDAHSPGRTIRLFTPHDQAPMAVNYATETGESQTHTGVQVRIAAVGPRAANVTGLLDQTDLFFIIRDALGLN